MSDSIVKLQNNPYGQVSFENFRQDDQAFADKSYIIKYLDDNSMSKYPVLLRPRRFGKSIAKEKPPEQKFRRLSR